MMRRRGSTLGFSNRIPNFFFFLHGCLDDVKLRVTIWDTYYYAVIASFEGLQSVGGNDLRPFKVSTDVIVVVVVACSVSFSHVS